VPDEVPRLRDVGLVDPVIRHIPADKQIRLKRTQTVNGFFDGIPIVGHRDQARTGGSSAVKPEEFSVWAGRARVYDAIAQRNRNKANGVIILCGRQVRKTGQGG
jgi:GH43 family beta-xylosidase